MMKTYSVLLGVLTSLVLSGMAWAAEPFSKGIFIPPAAKALQDAESSPMNASVLTGYLTKMDRFHVYDLFAGQTSALKEKYPADKSKPLKAGEEMPVALASDDLFGTPIQDGDAYVFLGSLQSLDAEGVRLQVDLSALDSAAEVWIIDPSLPQAYGPYKAADYAEGAFWLATVFNDESVIMVRSPKAETPNVRVTAYLHLFRSLKDAALTCNISVACKDTAIQNAASATAVLSIGSEGYCSGTLIDNPQTAAAEPLLITANHCICAGSDARDTEAFWDFRETTCGNHDAGTMGSHPHSSGTKLLATSSTLDSTLIMLDSVPTGSYGRAYLGWDTREPVLNESVMVIHYPQASYNRVSTGRVELVDNGPDGFGYDHQNEMVWDEGVTEAGSSGSCVLFVDTMSIFGTLSNGTTHTCGTDRSNNIDFFSSFRDFYPQIKNYIDAASPSTAAGDDDCGDSGLCAAKVLLKDYPVLLDNLRALRDKVLLRYAITAPLVEAYYAAAPRIRDLVEHSAEARGMFLAVTLPIANAAGKAL